MPPILIDINRLLERKLLGRNPTGIDRVSLAYLHHYRASARAVLCRGSRTFSLSRHESERCFDLLLGERPGGAAATLGIWASALTLGWWRNGVAGQLLFNTGHMGLEDPRYAVGLRKSGARLICVVHDLIPITHPEYCRPGRRERHIERMTNIARFASGVVVNSCHTQQTLETFCRESGLTPPPIVVAPLGTNLPTSFRDSMPLQQPYFVVLGNIEPRKNHWMLLQLWRRLVDQHAAAAPRLVIIGQRAWECENVVDLLERCRQLRAFVIERASCGDEELVNMLRHARALLYPSFVEGFGLPIAEALSLGVPVIASDLAVFREFAGEVPEYADPLDGRRWLELIADYAQPHSARRAAQTARMPNFSAPTWAHHFERVDHFVSDLHGH
ncbi:MAG TPA: glycosyltransferase family 1 protein [Burkholderiaceae bacterium]|nr:glycosyltransferase family 1 protein [Burkholderiaceae bacterium]